MQLHHLSNLWAAPLDRSLVCWFNWLMIVLNTIYVRVNSNTWSRLHCRFFLGMTQYIYRICKCWVTSAIFSAERSFNLILMTWMNGMRAWVPGNRILTFLYNISWVFIKNFQEFTQNSLKKLQIFNVLNESLNEN